MANLSNINGKFVVEQTTGYVGIGTTNPNFLIEAAGTNAELALNASAIYRVRSTSNDEFIITKNGVGDRLFIAGGGNVGIGTNSPNAGVKLEVNGIISANGDQSPTGGGLGFGDYQTGGYKWIQSFESQELRINPLGNNVTFPASNVGIGTTSPQSKLHIYTSSTNAPIRLQNDNGSGSTANYVLQTDSSGLGNNGFGIYDVAQSAYRFVINGSGEVGIGTTSPDARLHIQGSSSEQKVLEISTAQSDGPYTAYKNTSSGTTTLGFIGNSQGIMNAGTTNFGIRANNDLTFSAGGGSERMRIDSAGNLLVGATSFQTGAFGGSATGINVAGIQPLVLLHETDTDKDGYIGISGSTMFMQTADAIPIRFGTSDTERMRITSGGNVGIGNTGPNNKLEISDTGAGTGSTHLKISRGADSSTVQRIAGIKMGNTASNDGSNWIIQADSSSGYFDNADLDFIHNSAGTPSTRMTLTSAGKLGVGTASPQNQFVIKEGSNVDMEFGSEADGCFIQTYNRTSSSWGYLRFIAGGGERMRITRVGGEVLINQTSDLTGQIFQVNGFIDQTDVTKAVRVYDGSTFVGGIGSGQWAISPSYATDYALYAQNNLLFHAGTGSSIDMRINANHNVVIDKNLGIGGRTPDTSWGSDCDILQVGAGDNDEGFFGWRAMSGADQLIMGWNCYHDNTNWKFDSNNPAGLYVQRNGSHWFYGAASGSADANINWTTQMYLDTGGNVGIGTASPTSKLTVRGTLTVGDSTTDNTIRRQHQTFSTMKPGPSSGGSVDMMFVDHTNALDITVMAYISTSSVATGKGYLVTAYGSAVGGLSNTRFAGAISALSISYVNTGGSENYVLRVTCTYSGATAPTISVTASGQSTSKLRAAI